MRPDSVPEPAPCPWTGPATSRYVRKTPNSRAFIPIRSEIDAQRQMRGEAAHVDPAPLYHESSHGVVLLREVVVEVADIVEVPIVIEVTDRIDLTPHDALGKIVGIHQRIGKHPRRIENPQGAVRAEQFFGIDGDVHLVLALKLEKERLGREGVPQVPHQAESITEEVLHA